MRIKKTKIMFAGHLKGIEHAFDNQENKLQELTTSHSSSNRASDFPDICNHKNYCINLDCKVFKKDCKIGNFYAKYGKDYMEFGV